MAAKTTTRVHLPQVTLCAVSSVNVAATMRALEASLAQIDVAACKFFTDAQVKPVHPDIAIVPITHIASSDAYSEFLLTQLVDHVETSHCLTIQWDGHVLDALRWRPAFLDHDYIGASWPQFTDGYDVGNGGFSLRSRRLMELCRDPAFQLSHPEDVAIGRINREWLESRGMRFAPCALSDLFSAERVGNVEETFGYHGAWHMPGVIGAEDFWRLYRDLDDRGTIRHDLANIVKKLCFGRGGLKPAFRLILDQIVFRSKR